MYEEVTILNNDLEIFDLISDIPALSVLGNKSPLYYLLKNEGTDLFTTFNFNGSRYTLIAFKSYNNQEDNGLFMLLSDEAFIAHHPVILKKFKDMGVKISQKFIDSFY